MVFVEPKYNDDHFSDAPPSDDHAPSSVTGGQALLRKIYAAMVQNPERWASTVMIITYDENGGLFDHAEPLPIATADPNGSYESFATTGVRVPALIVSPLLQARKVFRKPLDHTSILKFIGSKFGDNGLYSEVVSARASVGSVKDILDEFGIEDARPCPEPPAFLTSIEVQPAADRPVNAMSQAFEHALLQARKEQPAEAAIKFRELEAFFGDSIGLWQLVQAELGAKGFRIASDCQYLVRTLVEAGEANLLKQPDRRTLAGSNLTLLANQMMVNAGKRGSHMVEEQDFYDARNQWCPLWPFC